MTQPGAYHKRLPRARQKRAQQAKRRRLQRERERLQQEQVRARRTLRALEQTVQELSLLETVAEDLQWRLQAPQKLLGKLFGMTFPPAVRLPQLPRAVLGTRLG